MRHRSKKKMLEECLSSSVNHSGDNVMVWVCFRMIMTFAIKLKRVQLKDPGVISVS